MRAPSSATMLLLIAATACSTACSSLIASSTAMHEASPAALATPKDRALVVFLRPSYFGAIYALRVIDENGFVADVPSDTHVAVTLPPGKHLFTTIGRETEVLMKAENILFAELAAGRVYFVLVDVDFGGPNLKALTASSPDWTYVREWIDDTKGLEPNDDALGRSVIRGDIVIFDAKKRAARLGPISLAERTLKEEDGVVRAWDRCPFTGRAGCP